MAKELYEASLRYGDARVYVDCYIEQDGRKETRAFLLHEFQALSEPDHLFRYLLVEANGRPVTRKQLLDEKILISKKLDFTRVVTEQTGFQDPLKRLFVISLGPSKVQLKLKVKLTELQLTKVMAYLKSVEHSESTDSKYHILQHIPE